MNQPLLILALLAALSCCQTAPAQQARDATAVQSSPGYSQLSVQNESGALMLVIGPGGQITAVHDGTVLKPERVRHEDDHLRIVDEAGATLYDIRLLPNGGLVFPYDARVASATYWPSPEPFARWSVNSTPRKIIGVTVDPVDAVVCAQLDLEPDTAFVIGSVTEGLPAEKAGVQPHDVVVSIQGDTPATVQRLREVLDAKQPGDTIELEVLRRGERMQLEVGVAEESEADSMFSADYGAGADWADFLGDKTAQASAYTDMARSLSDEAYRRQAELEAANDRLAELQDELAAANDALAEARENSSNDEAGRLAVKEHRAQVEALRAEMLKQQELLRSNSAAMQLFDLGSGGRALMLPPNSSAFGGTAPAPAALPDDVDDRLHSMEDRLSRLEELLEKLVESDAAKK